MEFNKTSLNINLTDDELDRILCFGDKENISESQPNNEEFISPISQSSQFQINKNSLQFDSGNASDDIFNSEFMDIDNSECVNLCIKETDKNECQNIDKTPPIFCTDEFKSQNKIFEFSNSILPETNEGNFLSLTNFNNNNFNLLNVYNNQQKSNQLIGKYTNLEGLSLVNHKINHTASDLVLRDFIDLPQSIVQLYQSIRSSYSDFAFVYAISAQLCQEFIPMDCFVILKMSLLLSITSLSINNQNNKPIPIVVIGSDSALINRIMLHIGQNIPKRFISQTDNLENIGGIITQENMIEAGPALLAKYGVLYLGDWSHIKSNHADKVIKEIERGTLSIEKSNLNYPLQCSIWCYWTGSFKNNTKDKRTLNSFMEIFGIPVVLNEKATGKVLIDFLLEQAMQKINIVPDDGLKIELNDMKEYLKIISNRKVEFGTEALDVIQKYFIASRTDRPGCLTQQSFTILKAYSESFAKLSLRQNVIVEDVIASIYLIELSIQNIYGFGVYPAPEFISFNNSVGEIDVFMKKFENWLNGYIKRFN